MDSTPLKNVKESVQKLLQNIWEPALNIEEATHLYTISEILEKINLSLSEKLTAEELTIFLKENEYKQYSIGMKIVWMLNKK